ncbi:hypothetical protein BCR39DRAFT_560630 [Naematelia encephala]|uniref:Uncharacterized protein n=1 Tax=Naematelia encephala TaxID=71784 RepID=A0A1Y2AUJ4_9TREE|nr:hypothetical protein BCR39DRAFT_560630 [Naematelia encephala]
MYHRDGLEEGEARASRSGLSLLLEALALPEKARPEYSLYTQSYLNPSSIEGKSLDRKLFLERTANWLEHGVYARLEVPTRLMSSSKKRKESFYQSLEMCSWLLSEAQVPYTLLSDTDLKAEYQRFREETTIFVVATEEMYGDEQSTKTLDQYWTKSVPWPGDRPEDSSCRAFCRIHPSVFDRGREPQASSQGGEPKANNQGEQGPVVSEIPSDSERPTGIHSSSDGLGDVQVTELSPNAETDPSQQVGDDDRVGKDDGPTAGSQGGHSEGRVSVPGGEIESAGVSPSEVEVFAGDGDASIEWSLDLNGTALALNVETITGPSRGEVSVVFS